MHVCNSTGRHVQWYIYVYKSESYVTIHMSYRDRKAFAKFRLGVAPLAVETGRYAGTQRERRTCFHCTNHVEDEKHVIFDCPLYTDITHDIIRKLQMSEPNFDALNSEQKLILFLSSDDVCRLAAKTCKLILERRQCLMYNNSLSQPNDGRLR